MNEKRYRECMAEIIGALKKYDMAGAVTVVDKERCILGPDAVHQHINGLPAAVER